ncbi:MAG: hypothetical protein KF729_22945 [Sandaracinaceae bacterium]|nr:hypothetical protein [Sandaracinaceae bacterium]
MSELPAPLERALVDERRRHGRVRLPWVAFPGMHPFDLGWRMGAGETHLILLAHDAGDRSLEARRAEVIAAGPVPADWAFWVAERLELPGTADDPDLGPYALAFDEVRDALAALGIDVGGEPA